MAKGRTRVLSSGSRNDILPRCRWRCQITNVNYAVSALAAAECQASEPALCHPDSLTSIVCRMTTPRVSSTMLYIHYPLTASRRAYHMSHSSVTYHDIVRGLHHLGVMRGATLEVHSSLSAFGWVEGGAATVIQALMDVLSPDGTLIMSAYPVTPAIPLTDEDRERGITWKVRMLPTDASEPTGMGRIADTFRQRADVVCGSDFFRTCAWGRDAEWHCDGYQGLLAVDGSCLLLGVGIDRCSSMHAAESLPIPKQIAAC